MSWLEAQPVAAGLIGGFVSTLASNGSAVTLPALEVLGLPEHVANGTNRLDWSFTRLPKRAKRLPPPAIKGFRIAGTCRRL